MSRNLAKFVSQGNRAPAQLAGRLAQERLERLDGLPDPLPLQPRAADLRRKRFRQAQGVRRWPAGCFSRTPTAGRDEFNHWAELLAYKLFDQDLKDLPADHFVYNALFKPRRKIPAARRRQRDAHAHDPFADRHLASAGSAKGASNDRAVYELGANLFVYSTGMQVPRNRLDTLYVDGSARQAEDDRPDRAAEVRRRLGPRALGVGTRAAACSAARRASA